MAPQSITGIDPVRDPTASAYRPERVPTAPDPIQAEAPKAAPEPVKPDLPPAPALKRLMIEEIGHTGRYVYKLLDPVSGEVVVQLPREELVKMSEADHYAAGSVIQTEA